MTPAVLHEMLADRLNAIEAALTRARLGQLEAVKALQDHLLDVLRLVPRDPGLDSATDDLHRAALAMAARREPTPSVRHERLLADARGRLLRRLEAAGFELIATDRQEP